MNRKLSSVSLPVHRLLPVSPRVLFRVVVDWPACAHGRLRACLTGGIIFGPEWAIQRRIGIISLISLHASPRSNVSWCQGKQWDASLSIPVLDYSIFDQAFVGHHTQLVVLWLVFEGPT